jgi:uncharacterized protein (DUF1499 family)
MVTVATAGTRWPVWLTKIGSLTGLLGLVLLIVVGPGYRIGLLPLAPALLCAALGFLLLVIAFLIGGIGLLAGRGRSPRTSRAAIAIVALAGLATISAGFWIARLRGAPPIHDITTDYENPPEFQDIVPLRQAAGAANAPEYQRTQRMNGREIDVIDAQRRAYADVQPQFLPQAPVQALELAEPAAQAMKWSIVTVDRGDGRIEAMDTTWYFGFKDDVVIRVRPDPRGSRVDIRSASRVGVGDVGANARRIREYMAQLRRLAGT